MTSKFLKTLPKYNNRNINNINTEKIKNKPLPKIMKAKLKNQENILKRLFTYENIQTNIENLISKKTKKNKLNIFFFFNIYIFKTDFDFSCINNLYSFSVNFILNITSFHFIPPLNIKLNYTYIYLLSK